MGYIIVVFAYFALFYCQLFLEFARPFSKMSLLPLAQEDGPRHLPKMVFAVVVAAVAAAAVQGDGEDEDEGHGRHLGQVVGIYALVLEIPFLTSV